MTLPVALIIAIILFVVGCVLAAMQRDKSPLFFVVTAAAFLYIFGGVLQ